MQFEPSQILGMQSWYAEKGSYAFLILKDNYGFICSYKNYNNPQLSRVFKKNKEFIPDDINSIASTTYYHIDLIEAQKDCRKKYKELLLR